MSGIATVLLVTLPLSIQAHPICYATFVVISTGIIGSQYALMPSAITDYFGVQYASINIGIVYMATVSTSRE